MMDIVKGIAALVFWPFVLLLCACQPELLKPDQKSNAPVCDMSFVILGIGQDAGVPQIGNAQDPGWSEPGLSMLAVSAAVIDRQAKQRYLFEATPDIRRQLKNLDDIMPPEQGSLGLSGVFLTHAHIGHYAGLMFFGRESAGTQDIPVFAMPRMKSFLESNGPWDQLARLGNIDLKPLGDGTSVNLSDELSVTPLKVPHRDEYSETVGFIIRGPKRSVFFLPDIDGWAQWSAEAGVNIEDIVRSVDYAYLDATFYNDFELPGRDMSKIPHPRVTDTMARFEAAGPAQAQKVRFIHFNHTNKIRYPGSKERKEVDKRGFHIAQEGEQICLSK